jgi:hypothetical protein
MIQIWQGLTRSSTTSPRSINNFIVDASEERVINPNPSTLTDRSLSILNTQNTRLSIGMGNMAEVHKYGRVSIYLSG